MPWHIKSNSSSCPKSKPYAVIQDSNSKVMGCHATKAGAQQQMAALYANEGKSAMDKNASRLQRPPLDGVREAPFALRKDSGDESNDGLTLDGYGAVFDRETVINSWEGRFKEKIAPGSMKRSFRETPPKIQFDHGRHPMIGSIPIAELRSITEDSDPVLAPNGGAHVVGRVFNNWLMAPVRDAIAAGAINGMSFRFSVIREEWKGPSGELIKDEDELMDALSRTLEAISDDDLLVRTLKELKVPEIGPVTWPAYEETSVSVRSKVIDLGRLHEPEQRELLAHAVFIADTADSQDEDSQRDTSPEVTEIEDVAVERQSQTVTPDAQQDTEPVVEHPSKPRGYRAIDVMVRTSRDVLLNIDRKARK